jgi:hypothetical protein
MYLSDITPVQDPSVTLLRRSCDETLADMVETALSWDRRKRPSPNKCGKGLQIANTPTSGSDFRHHILRVLTSHRLDVGNDVLLNSGEVIEDYE